MSLRVTLDLNFKPDALDDARLVMGRVLAETRTFEGCLGADVLIDQNEPAHWLVLETWQSVAHDSAYREFRSGPGAITDLGPLLAAAPSITKFIAEPTV